LDAVASWAGIIEKRYLRQKDRIEVGTAKDEITPQEALILRNEHDRIYLFKNNPMERLDRHYYDDISYKRSTVSEPLFLPPFPPPPVGVYWN